MSHPIDQKRREKMWIYYQKLRERFAKGAEIKFRSMILIQARKLSMSKSSAWNIIQQERHRLVELNKTAKVR